MIDETSTNIIDQLTLRKLVYARELLKSAKLPYSGTRIKIRERLIDGIEKGIFETASLRATLDQLDAWGDQRIRIGIIPLSILADYQSELAILEKAKEVQMENLINGEILLNPPLEMTPMQIIYKEIDGQKVLWFVAAKTRQVMQPQLDIPDKVYEELPDVVFKPFKLETQKAISFAEINLNNGFTILSTTLIRRGSKYDAEFNEFYSAFHAFLNLEDLEPIYLFNANRKIRDLSHSEIRLVARQSKTSSGGKIDGRSHSVRFDMRADTELDLTFAALPDALGLYCNCFWEPLNSLIEPVHTHIYAPTGEVSIMGQVLEASAKYVLRRILDLN
jgi:hypothetical protein